MSSERLKRILEKERLLAEKLNVQSTSNPSSTQLIAPSYTIKIQPRTASSPCFPPSGSSSTTCSTSPSSLSSSPSLDEQLAQIRWQKDKQGSWSSKINITASFRRPDASNEAHCYKLSASQLYLPAETFESLNIPSAIERQHDFVSACSLLELLLRHYWRNCPRSTTQLLMLKEIGHIFNKSQHTETGMPRSQWLQAALRLFRTAQIEMEEEIKAWKLEKETISNLATQRLAEVEAFTRQTEEALTEINFPLDPSSDSSTTSTRMSDLPTEVVERVLLFLDSHLDVLNASEVCSLWWSLLQDDEKVYRRLYLSYSRRRLPLKSPRKTWKEIFIGFLIQSPLNGLSRCSNCNQVYWNKDVYSSVCRGSGRHYGKVISLDQVVEALVGSETKKIYNVYDIRRNVLVV